MRKTFLSLLAFLTLAALMLAACSRAPGSDAATPAATPTRTPSPTRTPTVPPPPTPTVVQGTVTIWHSWDETQVSALVQAIIDFQNQYPDVQFDVLYLPVDLLRSRYSAAVQEGTGPSIVLAPSEWAAELYGAGAAADLSSLPLGELLASLNLAGVQAGQVDGVQAGLPYALEGVVLYRNRSLVVETPADFDEMLSLATMVTAGDVFGAVLDRSFYFSGGHLYGLGGKLVDESGSPAFAGERGAAWVELLRRFEEAGPPVFDSDQDLELFRAGKAGWIVDGTWNMNALAEALGPQNVAIDPWPAVGESHLSGFVQSDQVYLNPQLSGPELTATWTFVQHFLSPAAQTLLLDVGMIPANTQVQIDDPLQVSLPAQAIVALAGGTAYPQAPPMDVYTPALNAALKSVFEAGTQPADALRQAHNEIIAILAGVQLTPTP